MDSIHLFSIYNHLPLVISTPLAYTYYMEFIETDVFTRIILELLSDDSYRELQEFLIKTPEFGDLIPGSKGLRKVRWKPENQGKQGGIRTIYYYKAADDQILFLYAYPKSKKDDLSPKQLKILSQIVEEWK